MIDSKGPADRQPGSIRFDSIRFARCAVCAAAGLEALPFWCSRLLRGGCT